MNEMSAMPGAVAQWLSGREELSQMKFMTEFPPIKKAVPLRKITVAVGISEINISDNFDSEENEFPEQDEYCRLAEIKLRFSIHSPYSLGGEGCHNAFADIIDCLTFDSGLDITSSGCSNITEDRDTDAFVLNAWIFVKSAICPSQSSDITFPSFLDKTLFCGSHIRDEDIHLSPSQQAFLSEPTVTGTYIGTGSSSRSIQLGFKPSAVIVFAGGFPFIINNSGEFKVYFGCCCGDGGSLGISVNNTGFKVSNTSREGSLSRLNESGISFTYIAYR